MCGRLCCPFRSSNSDSKTDLEDDLTRILIFGVTGMIGSAVMEATLSCAWFKITGFTRARDGEILDELVSKGIDVISGDMKDPNSLLVAMQEIDVIFLTTHYWETMSSENEYIQGYNVVNAAIQSGVKHLIYAGTDYNVLTAGEMCPYLEGKSRVEQYIVNIGIPSTIVHMAFFFENFVSVFKPHQTSRDTFAIALPMADNKLNMGSILDFGQCVAKIALRPNSFIFRTLNLSRTYMSVAEIAEAFNEQFVNLHFFDPQITLSEYKEFQFSGSKELGTMWEHYRSQTEWATDMLFELNLFSHSFKQFLFEREKLILEILLKAEEDMPIVDTDQEKGMDEPYTFSLSTILDKLRTFSFLPTTSYRSVQSPMTRQQMKEDEARNTKRRKVFRDVSRMTIRYTQVKPPMAEVKGSLVTTLLADRNETIV